MSRPFGSKNKVDKRTRKACKTCGNKFKITPYKIKKGWGKYCSLKCRPPSFGYKGKKHSIESKIKMSITHKGKILSTEHIKNITKALRNRSKIMMRTMKCLECHKNIKVSPAEFKYKKYCTTQCFHKNFGRKKSGKNHPLWKGGQIIDKRGYILVFSPLHPFRNSQKYVRKSRLTIEKYLGHYLNPGEVVHHKGINFPMNSIENRQDDSPENLKLFKNNNEHMRFHSKLRIKKGKKGFQKT